VEQIQLAVVKRSGVVEPFKRDKVIQGVRKACKGRPVSEIDLARLGQQVEESIRSLGLAEVPTQDIGLSILAPLRELDEVVYLRFASVYDNYGSLEDFETGIAELRGQLVSPQTPTNKERLAPCPTP
jgi:transcriptional repressor NrdR